MTFYLKYRPQKLEELDITEVRESFKKIVSSGKIPHSFLFSGPKGTGKTSAARIMAKILNCQARGTRQKAPEPCNRCEQCVSITKGSNLDVIELDAASHRGIDDVRALREAVKLSPALARKKVYIIDEAQMLTTEASNALLKILEEPPDHVIFILATTNPEKLIETIRSRVTNISFRKATDEEVLVSLGRIVKGEKIKIGKEALSLVADVSDGSFRDAAKILEQITVEKKNADAKFVEEFLFKRKTFNTDEFLKILAARDTKKALEAISQVIQKGGSMPILIEAVLTKLREGLLAKVGIGEDVLPDFSKEALIYLIELFIRAQSELKTATIEELPLEMAVVRWGGDGKLDVGSKKMEEEVGSEKKNSNISPRNLASHFSLPISIKNLSGEMWREILELVRPVNASIEALLRAARPLGYDGKTLTLGVFYRFHKERLEDGHHRRILEEVVASVLGTPIRIVCVLTEPPAKQLAEEVSTKGGSASGRKKEESVLTEGEDKDIIKVAEEIFGN